MEIVNKMVHKMEVEDQYVSSSVEKAIETSKKIQSVLSYLITKESILFIAQDSKVKNERFLSLNIHVDLSSLNIG